MDLNGIQYVYAVYQERSFSKAAEKLFISQPSLSASVKRIENQIGFSIFDRSTKPLGLTAGGRYYIEMAERVLSAEAEFETIARDLKELRTGTLSIGGSSLFMSWIIPSLAGNFSRIYPDIRLQLTEESTSNLKELLLSGKIDLLVENSALDSRLFDELSFRHERLFLAVPAHDRVNRKLTEYRLTAEQMRKGGPDEEIPDVPLSAFENEAFVLLKPGNDTRIRAVRLCEEAGFSPRILFEVDQQMTAYNITCSGLGLSFVSDTLIQVGANTQNVVFYRLSGEESRRDIRLFWKKGRYLSHAMEAFLKMIQAQEQ